MGGEHAEQQPVGARPDVLEVGVAAACDVVENVALLLVLGDPGRSGAPEVAQAFALAKFALLAVTLACLLAALVAYLGRRGAMMR